MSYCDKCIETCEKINKVTFQEKSVPHGEYEIKIEYLCQCCEKGLPYRNYPYIEIISSERMPNMGTKHVRV